MKEILNQIFEIDRKSRQNNIDLFDRNLRRVYHEFDTLGYYIKNPLGEKYSDLRTDIEATIVGDYSDTLKITKVLKPIIYKKVDDQPTIIQKGVVIVER